MTERELRRELRRAGCRELRQKGSHLVIRCLGGCQVVVPVHSGDLAPGVVRSIARVVEPCIGRQEWMH